VSPFGQQNPHRQARSQRRVYSTRAGRSGNQVGIHRFGRQRDAAIAKCVRPDLHGLVGLVEEPLFRGRARPTDDRQLLCLSRRRQVDDHDGERTGQHGLHQRWESGLLDHFVSQEGWVPEVRPAALGPEPAQAPWAWLQEAFDLVPGVLADDLTAKDASGAGGYGPVYWQTFLQLQEPGVKERLNLSAQRAAEMILLAWTLAGSPVAPRQ